jgi:serine/threonine protein phosphatase PrpC
MILRVRGDPALVGAVVGPAFGLVYDGDDARDVFSVVGDPVDVLANAHVALGGRGSPGVSAIACAVGPHLRLAWTGTCRAYLLRDGTARRLTRDQTLAEQLGAEGFAAEGRADAHLPLHRLGVRSAFVLSHALAAEAGDRVVLVTAGVFRDRTEAAVLDAVIEPDPERAADILVNGPSDLPAAALVMDGPGRAR